MNRVSTMASLLISVWLLSCPFIYAYQTVTVSYLDVPTSESTLIDVSITYPATAVPRPCAAFIFGAGTAMYTDEYSQIATKTAAFGHIFIVLDSNPNNIVKTNATKFAAAVTTIKANALQTWGLNRACPSGISTWIVGGHSASGWAAHEAVASDSNLADGVYSYEPNCNGCTLSSNITVPSVYLGLLPTLPSCFGFIPADTTRFFEASEPATRLAALYTNQEFQLIAAKYHHCAITDSNSCQVPFPIFGIPVDVCGGISNQIIWSDFATLASKFVLSLRTAGQFSFRTLTTWSTTSPIEFFEN